MSLKPKVSSLKSSNARSAPQSTRRTARSTLDFRLQTLDSPSPDLPFVLVNMAITADGKIATANRAISSFGSAHDHDHLLELPIADLAALPGNRLEALKGERAGRFSIRINDQWRICFRWPEGSPGPEDVEIVDYH